MVKIVLDLPGQFLASKVSFGDVSYVFLDPPTLRKLARLAP